MDKIEKDISIAWKRYAHDAGLEINTFEYNVSRQAFIYGYKEGKCKHQFAVWISLTKTTKRSRDGTITETTKINSPSQTSQAQKY